MGWSGRGGLRTLPRVGSRIFLQKVNSKRLKHLGKGPACDAATGMRGLGVPAGPCPVHLCQAKTLTVSAPGGLRRSREAAHLPRVGASHSRPGIKASPPPPRRNTLFISRFPDGPRSPPHSSGLSPNNPFSPLPLGWEEKTLTFQPRW